MFALRKFSVFFFVFLRSPSWILHCVDFGIPFHNQLSRPDSKVSILERLVHYFPYWCCLGFSKFPARYRPNVPIIFLEPCLKRKIVVLRIVWDVIRGMTLLECLAFIYIFEDYIIRLLTEVIVIDISSVMVALMNN